MENRTSLSPEQIKNVKGLGFLINRGTNNFNARVITENGLISAQQLRIVSEAADKYGNGTVTFTVRLTLEVPGIDFENIQPFRIYIAQAGLVTGGTGSRVRPVVACKGSTCIFGLCDTQGLATEIHKRFYEGYYDVVLPHKFKIAIGGCPNNCAKPDLNDIGLIGQRVPQFDLDKCRGCGKCGVVDSCPMDGVRVEDGKIVLNSNCNNCGRCIKKCPFLVSEKSVDMYQVYIGGKWGKKIRMGTAVSKLFTKDEVLDVVEKSILLFKSKGNSGERFGETIDRIGIDKADKMLIANNLLNNKEEILEIQTIAGAKC